MIVGKLRPLQLRFPNGKAGPDLLIMRMVHSSAFSENSFQKITPFAYKKLSFVSNRFCSLCQNHSQEQLVTHKPAHKIKELLGYQLNERIGVGGYGEVWSAVAPGGLKKAVKLVYGYHDENRAQTELKAMARVKEVRHPFLISLERIEIHEGQLIVVSELADGNLAEVYEACVSQGNDGIPRDELLKYIGDAAEGLDYLYETHSLQHLNVKLEYI